MELVVAVSKIEIQGVERIDLRCSAEARGEIKTESTIVALDGGRNSGSCPTFKFSFTDPSPNADLQFAAFHSAGASELGSCRFPISLQGSNVLSKQTISKQTKVSLLSSKIEGTDVQKFVGKIWFRVTPNFKNQPTLLADVKNLITREAENMCTAHLPCDSPTVSVVFHCVNSTKSFKQLRPIACIGSDNGLSIDTILQETDGQNLAVTPILCPITLCCHQHQNIELHIADKMKGRLVFSSSHSISSLTPFVHSNTRYTREWMSGNKVFGPSQLPDNHEPSITISLVYRPAISEFKNFEGLEFLVGSMDVNPTMQHRDILLCTQLTSNDSKTRVQGANGHDSPFERQINKKGSSQSSPLYNYSVTVVRFNAAVEQLSTDPAYFFFPASPYFTANKTGVTLAIYIYAADASKSQPWWQTPLITSAKLEITSRHKTLLEQQKASSGVYWELSTSDINQLGTSPVTTKICGVIRWKSKQMHFLSHQPEYKRLPRYDLLLEPEIGTTHSPAFQIPPAIIPTLHTSEHVASKEALSEEEYRKAISEMGQDILKLRHENAMLQKENLELQARQMKVNATPAGQRELQSLSREELFHKILKLQENLVAESESRKTCQDRVAALQNTLIKKNDFEVQYIELQDAHTAQQKLIRQLHTKVDKYRKCSEICKQQENVITQLELLLAQQTQDQGDADTLSMLRKENVRLRGLIREHQESEVNSNHSHLHSLLQELEDQLRSLQAERSKLTHKCQDLELQLSVVQQGAHGGTSGQVMYSEQSKVFQLEQRLLMSEAHINTLTAELRESARRWDLEKAKYELQLIDCKNKIEATQKQGENEASPKVNVNPPVIRQTF